MHNGAQQHAGDRGQGGSVVGFQVRTVAHVQSRQTGQAVACRAHNRRAVGTSGKRLRRKRQALLRAPSTRHPAGQELPSAASMRASLRTSDRRQEGKPVIWMRSVAHVQADQEAKSASISAHQKRADGVQPATIDVQLDGQIGNQRRGKKTMEKRRQDKRDVRVVSVFAADSGTCSADVVAEGHTNIGWQDKRNPFAVFAIH